MTAFRLAAVILSVFLATSAGGQDVFDPLDPSDDDEQTGLAVGERIPDFRAVDQHGKTVGFDDFKGENGAVLVFHRSADW